MNISYSTFLRYLGGRLRSFRKPVVTPMMDEYLAGIRSGQWSEHLKEFGIKYRKKERQAQKKVRDWFREGVAHCDPAADVGSVEGQDRRGRHISPQGQPLK